MCSRNNNPEEERTLTSCCTADETQTYQAISYWINIGQYEVSEYAGSVRHELTQQPTTPPGVRVVTYNVLADQYAATDFAQKHLFAYCRPKCVPRSFEFSVHSIYLHLPCVFAVASPCR